MAELIMPDFIKVFWAMFEGSENYRECGCCHMHYRQRDFKGDNTFCETCINDIYKLLKLVEIRTQSLAKKVEKYETMAQKRSLTQKQIEEQNFILAEHAHYAGLNTAMNWRDVAGNSSFWSECVQCKRQYLTLLMEQGRCKCCHYESIPADLLTAGRELTAETKQMLGLQEILK